ERHARHGEAGLNVTWHPSMVAFPMVSLGAAPLPLAPIDIRPAGARLRKESRMTASSCPSAVLLVCLAAASFLAMTVGLMLGPLLVALATAFHTSVAVTGQLTAATAITWGLTAFLAGPVADTYGRRRMLLTGLMVLGLGTLSAAAAWNYYTLLVCRCL